MSARALSTAVFLALKLGRPLQLEGEAGVGKTEIAKVIAAGLGRRLIRLQYYEWLDPLLRWDGFAPRANGIKAMLPHVDSFRVGHSIATFEAFGGRSFRCK